MSDDKTIEMRAALIELEDACDAVCKLRSQEIYLLMIKVPGTSDALERLDCARRRARDSTKHDRPLPSIREKFVKDGDMADQSWDEWCSRLNKLAAADPDRYTADAIEHCGAECWRVFYDDGYTAADAWHEDGAYD